MEKERKGRVFTLGVVTGLFIASIVVMVAVLCMRLVGDNKPLTGDALKNEQAAQKVETSVVNKDVLAKISGLEQMIYTYYYEDVDEPTLEKGIYNGLMSAMGDPYTTYYSVEEMEDLTAGLQGIYFGIGAYLSMDYDAGYVIIDSVIPETPAEEGGLKSGDVIYKINDEDAYGLTTNEVALKVRGEEGTTVDLTVLRSGEEMDFTLTRKKIESPTVKYEILDNDIAHVTITEFDEVTLAQYDEVMEEVMGKNPKGIILDLRGNPGGSLDSVVAIAQRILPQGMIVYTEDKNGQREEYTCDGLQQLKLPLVVLADGGSASASEILVGAIKDHGVGTFVGSQTFGKGIVQKIFPLTDGSAIKITVSHYFTPNGNNIHKVGIEPDISVDFDTEAYKKDKTDNQLNKAIEVMEEKIGITD